MGPGGTIALLFALVAIGYLLAWRGVLREGAGEALGDFVVAVAIPALLFRTLAEADFEGARPLALWAVYFATIATVWTLATLAIRRGFARDARAGVVAGLAASFSNLVLLGIPVILALFGREGTEILSLLIAVHLPVMMAASLVLHERAERLDGTRESGAGAAALARRFVVSMGTNPIIAGIVLGLLWRLSPFALPTFVAELVDRLAGVAGTLALIALGTSLRRFGIARNLPQASVTAALKLLLMPAVATLLALTAGLPSTVAQIVVVCAAMPAGVNPYLIAARLGTGEALASNTLLIATALSPVTLLGWAWVARVVF